MRTRFDSTLTEFPAEIREAAVAIGKGALLRVELPTIAPQFGVEDEYVLYTDVDVMFKRDPCGLLENCTPRYFAVAPERHTADGMNSGVMLMNMPRLRRDAAPFYAYLARHLPRFRTKAWDQDGYAEFYSWAHPPVMLRKLARRLGIGKTRVWDRIPLELNPDPLWDELPLELNWKAYWPSSENAAIVHFHGPKPGDRERCRRLQCPPNIQELARAEYYAACDQWEIEHARVLSTSPSVGL